MAQHLARGCFRMGTRNTKQDGELDRRWLWQRRHVDRLMGYAGGGGQSQVTAS